MDTASGSRTPKEAMNAGNKKSRFQQDLEFIMQFTDEIPQMTFVLHLTPEMEQTLMVEILGLSGKAYFVANRTKCGTAADICDRWNDLTNVKGNGKNGAKAVHRAFMEWYYEQLSPRERQRFWRESLTSTGVTAFDYIGG